MYPRWSRSGWAESSHELIVKIFEEMGSTVVAPSGEVV